MGNEISMGEADLILEKLYSESVPVVAYYVRGGFMNAQADIHTTIIRCGTPDCD
jgi:hypothetical protein